MVDEHVVPPSRPSGPPGFEQASTPAAFVASAPLNRFTRVSVVQTPVVHAVQRERPTMMLGVPESAVTLTSITVAFSETWHSLFCGPSWAFERAEPDASPNTMSHSRLASPFELVK